MVATLMAWMNRPSKELDPLHPNTFLVHEVGHTPGIVTMPAGVMALALGVLTLCWARSLRTGTRGAGLVALGISVAALGVCVGEFTQLLLGRRNWLSHFTLSPRMSSPLANAVGVGVWVASLSSLALLAVSGIYLWREEGSWRDVPATRDEDPRAPR